MVVNTYKNKICLLMKKFLQAAFFQVHELDKTHIIFTRLSAALVEGFSFCLFVFLKKIALGLTL